MKLKQQEKVSNYDEKHFLFSSKQYPIGSSSDSLDFIDLSSTLQGIPNLPSNSIPTTQLSNMAPPALSPKAINTIKKVYY